MSTTSSPDLAGLSPLVREGQILRLPKDEMDEHGTGSHVAYDLLKNELLLDGSARLNLATFVTTWMPPYAAQQAMPGAEQPATAVVTPVGPPKDMELLFKPRGKVIPPSEIPKATGQQ